MSVDLTDLVGIPFVDRGRTLDGLDCWGLVKVAEERYGIEVPDVTISAFDTNNIMNCMTNQMELWEKVSEPQAGDVVAMNMDYDLPDIVQHFAVYIGNGRMLHTLQKMGSMIVRVDHPIFKNKVVGYYRWKNAR